MAWIICIQMQKYYYKQNLQYHVAENVYHMPYQCPPHVNYGVLLGKIMTSTCNIIN